MSSNISKLTENYLDNYCQEKKYTVKKTPKDNFTRIDISNLTETIPLSLYETGALVVGGSPKFKLKSEFEGLKQKITENPEILGGIETQKVKACATKYTILLENTREDIKNNLSIIEKNYLAKVDTPIIYVNRVNRKAVYKRLETFAHGKTKSGLY